MAHDTILKAPSKLTDKQLATLLSRLEVEKSRRETGKQHTKDAEVHSCPVCKSTTYVKCGKTAAGTQRYKCKSCGKIFTPQINLLFKNSHLTQEQWAELVRGIVDELSLTKIAQNIGTSVKTAWYNKTKIATVLSQIYPTQDSFIDIAECDECFVHLSFKGKRNPDFFINTLHRMPRHHRSKEEKIEYLKNAGLWDQVSSNPKHLAELLYGDYNQPGTNRDNVCILSGKDRSNHLYMKPACVGNIQSNHVEAHFQNRFADDAILVTDENNAYKWFAEYTGIHHEQINSNLHVKGPYSLSRINAFHSDLRGYWPKTKNKYPATKYLDLGLMIFWWLEKNKGPTEQQAKELLATISTLQTPTDPDLAKQFAITYLTLKNRPLPLDTKHIIPDYV